MTKQQLALLDFIKAYVAANNGIPPSFDEMKDGLGLVSKSGVHRLVTALERAGKIRRLRHRARTIELVEEGKYAVSFLPEVERAVGRYIASKRITRETLIREAVAAYLGVAQ